MSRLCLAWLVGFERRYGTERRGGERGGRNQPGGGKRIIETKGLCGKEEKEEEEGEARDFFGALLKSTGE